jgi:predicted RecA/RadA family phage recombinase
MWIIAHAGSGDDVTLSEELAAAIEEIRAAAAGTAPKEGSQRALPKHINQMLHGFACTLYRESAASKAAIKQAVDVLMGFLEPFTSRSNLMVRLRQEWDKAQGHEAATSAVLIEQIQQRVKGALLNAPSWHVCALRQYAMVHELVLRVGCHHYNPTSLYIWRQGDCVLMHVQLSKQSPSRQGTMTLFRAVPCQDQQMGAGYGMRTWNTSSTCTSIEPCWCVAPYLGHQFFL